jgi:DNA invertase Pin-like site-specific DNA recombinase
MAKIRSAIYSRCSTTEQFPENQLLALHDLAERNDHEDRC